LHTERKGILDISQKKRRYEKEELGGVIDLHSFEMTAFHGVMKHLLFEQFARMQKSCQTIIFPLSLSTVVHQFSTFW
jgi:hypothetical protein